MNVLSERVKSLRNVKGQSQKDVAKALGKSREAISKYERGTRNLDPDAIILFAKYFNVSSDYMLGITDYIEEMASGKRTPYSPELYAFEKYLNNQAFIPYLELAVRMKDSNIEINRFEVLINKLIKQAKKEKHL
ncbi:helix-turn-helix domain protein [Ruminiclostridium papyrosolvens DSM 2782]|uniref:Helix-turn-helix domain protein n=1 Tax=Ruminiclostridium papyrosolvens DSM 2782 TaxID=588581 RepID=F1TIF5_9FIRM|nr:helix-turn-helix transcriptional regulator [Ruminiclostridium papyrosolvens]EGD45772.1 helix-turn-helix domain protein [Ruminiclostridium papyrosolvens DSM 2782]WES33907.1 helix-turn-helix transcriptional regulator [Ruminiclostridium papyrosolvens DSM 2782]